MISIEDGNRMIAEFMGLYQSESGDFSGDIHKAWYTKDGYKKYDGDPIPYHTSFDWLMPAVEKISDLRFKRHTCVRFEIVPLGYVKVSDFGGMPITTNVSIEGSLLTAVYKAVVQFIQWYNQQNKQP